MGSPEGENFLREMESVASGQGGQCTDIHWRLRTQNCGGLCCFSCRRGHLSPAASLIHGAWEGISRSWQSSPTPDSSSLAIRRASLVLASVLGQFCLLAAGAPDKPLSEYVLLTLRLGLAVALDILV